MTITQAHLAPCPFCGGADIIDADYGQEYWCKCRLCGCETGKYGSRFSADEAWNRRALAATVAEPVEVVADAFSMSDSGLVTWTADEIADGKRGIRWVMDDKVYGRPTDHDCREYLAGNPNACGCRCDKCNPPAPPHDAELVELLLDMRIFIDDMKWPQRMRERIDAKLASLRGVKP